MAKAISKGEAAPLADDDRTESQHNDSAIDTDALFEVSEVVRQLLVRVRRNLTQSVSKHHINLSVQAVHILILIHRPDMNSPMKLACHSGYDKAVITRIVKQLLQDGLVNKHPDKHDKRSIKLSLTAKGQALHRQLDAVRLDAHQAIFSPLSNAELRQVKSLLQKCL